MSPKIVQHKYSTDQNNPLYFSKQTRTEPEQNYFLILTILLYSTDQNKPLYFQNGIETEPEQNQTKSKP